MHNKFDHLSLWEIAHRWHDLDPNLSSEKSLPLKVQDTIRLLSHSLIHCEISVCRPSGVQEKNPDECPHLKDYWPQGIWRKREASDPLYKKDDPIPDWNPLADDDENFYKEQIYIEPEDLTDNEVEEQYYDFRENWGKRHYETVDQLELTYKHRIYDREKLETIHINRSNIAKLCHLNEVAIPTFWFNQEETKILNAHPEWDPEHDAQPNQNSTQIINPPTEARAKQVDIDSYWDRLNHKQKSRILCREISVRLWHDNPDRTITSIISDPSLLNIGGGKHYQGKNTLRDWIKDLDRRPDDQKIGRPKNK